MALPLRSSQPLQPHPVGTPARARRPVPAAAVAAAREPGRAHGRGRRSRPAAPHRPRPLRRRGGRHRRLRGRDGGGHPHRPPRPAGVTGRSHGGRSGGRVPSRPTGRHVVVDRGGPRRRRRPPGSGRSAGSPQRWRHASGGRDHPGPSRVGGGTAMSGAAHAARRCPTRCLPAASRAAPAGSRPAGRERAAAPVGRRPVRCGPCNARTARAPTPAWSTPVRSRAAPPSGGAGECTDLRPALHHLRALRRTVPGRHEAVGPAGAVRGREGDRRRDGGLQGTARQRRGDRARWPTRWRRWCGRSTPGLSTETIGRAVLDRLRCLDQVAYLRFASVYKGFDNAADFARELRLLEIAEPGGR